MFTEMRDTVGLIMLDQGADPADFTDDQFDAAIALLQEATDSGHIRSFADANYGQNLSKGTFAASMTYSGDINQLRLDNDALELVIPESGFILWSDNMMIPVGALHQSNAEKWMDFYYRPEVAADVAAWVNFITPVVGAKEELTKVDPDLASNELIFPSDEFLSQGSIFMALDEEQEVDYQDGVQRRARVIAAGSVSGLDGRGETVVHARGKERALFAVLLDQHLALGMHARHQVATLIRHDDLDLDRRMRQECVDPRVQIVDPLTGPRRDDDRAGSCLRSRAMVRGSARSALLMTTTSGRLAAPISASTSRTDAICCSGSGSDASTTCSTRSASVTSSRVERNASTSWWGRWRTNPTVSASVYTRPSLVCALRTVGSSVANSELSTRTPAPVRRFIRLDLPAFV